MTRLDEVDWRYFVIAFQGYDDRLSRVQEAFDIGPLELEVGFVIHASQGLTTQFYPARFFHVLQEANPANAAFFIDVSTAQVEGTRNLAEKLERHDHTILNLQPLITQIRSLKALQHQSPLRFLGYFAILEALLTHAPKPSDPYDSITRQVKQKVALLNNRWTTKLNYAPFAGASPGKVWTAMYAYRSKLAHGANVEFADPDLRVLEDRERALKLLIDTVKASIRQALDEPQLLVDLRGC